MSFKIENPLGSGQEWKVCEDERTDQLRLINPNNLFRGIVTIDELGTHVEGPIATEAPEEVVQHIAELIDHALSEEIAA